MLDSGKGQVRAATLPPLTKAEGAFLALAAGDALGWPQEIPRNVQRPPTDRPAHIEFKQWTRRSGGRFQPYEEVIHPGEYSDDTQLTLAIARSRTNHGSAWWKSFTRVELPLWTLYERGGGGATKRAAKAWVDGNPPWKSKKKDTVRQYFEAGGNGVAMRVLPHAIFLAGQEDSSALIHDVVLDGSATHGHPRALLGATVYAYAAWWLTRKTSTLQFGELLDALIDETPNWGTFPESARNGGTWFDAASHATGGRYESIWDQTVTETRGLLEKARKGARAGALADDPSVLKELGCFGRNKGAGTSSAAAATYFVTRHATQPVQGILRAAFENGTDTDTLAAMTGGIMGCLAGIEWLPRPWLEVQDANHLRNIATQVAMGPDGAEQHPVKCPLNPQSILSDLARNGAGEVLLGDSKRARAVALPNPKPIANSITVREWRLTTSDGQTMYVTKVDRLAKKTRGNKLDNKSKQAHTSASQRECTNEIIGFGPGSKNVLYSEFCRHLKTLLGTGEMKPKEIEDALGLVQPQAKKWLEQAEQDRLIQQTSNRPRKYALCHQQNLL